ncbi:response regulator transcription factor [Marinobacterium aestuariivivens]|uniref:Response regulator transcription factor n=1 Tax=Marinobacterium aestuariivivens TaxID=1698799 RepID=A0ABW2A6C8_9GAMM
MHSEQHKVILIDDDPAVREALGLTLRHAGLDVEDYDSAEAYLECCNPQRHGCLVLDLNMPGMSGLELQQTLVQRDIRIPIIFLSAHGDIPTSVKAVKAGAVDFLPKPFRGRDLLARVEEALEKGRVLRRKAEEIARVLQRFERLTPREREVMASVVTGLSSKEVARELRLSHRTVEIHRARIMEKMEAASVAELVGLALVCGILELPVGMP